MRADQTAFVENKCMEMEKAGNNSKKVYSLVKELTQKSSARSDVINDKSGATLTESADIKTRWVEYCSELYEQKNAEEPTVTDPDDLECEPPPLLDEIRKAVHEIRNGKSPGYDDIPGELWKASGEEGINIMWKLCTNIWKTAEWPKDWGRAVFKETSRNAQTIAPSASGLTQGTPFTIYSLRDSIIWIGVLDHETCRQKED